MCEILDQIENRGIQKGMEIMRAEKDAVIAENRHCLQKRRLLLQRKKQNYVNDIWGNILLL